MAKSGFILVTINLWKDSHRGTIEVQMKDYPTKVQWISRRSKKLWPTAPEMWIFHPDIEIIELVVQPDHHKGFQAVIQEMGQIHMVGKNSEEKLGCKSSVEDSLLSEQWAKPEFLQHVSCLVSESHMGGLPLGYVCICFPPVQAKFVIWFIFKQSINTITSMSNGFNTRASMDSIQKSCDRNR